MSADDASHAPYGRREIIVARAAELLARKGIAGTTVREIGDAAGILSGSLYHHFDSKDAIVDVVMSAYLDDLLERYRLVLEENEDVTELFHGLLQASVGAIGAHRQATIIYQHEVHYFRDTPRFRQVRIAGERVRETWLGVLEAAVAEGVFRSDMPARHLYLLLRDGLWLTVRWFRPSAAYGFEELAADCGRLYYQAFASKRTLRAILDQAS